MPCIVNAVPPDLSSPSTSISQLSMGIGQYGSDQNLVLKRRFRWLFSISTCGGSNVVPPYFVKVSSRPDIAIEATEINFLNEKTWVPGKAAWEEITVTYLDVATTSSNGGNIALWNWLASVYDYTCSARWMNSRLQDWAGTASLVMLDGCGNLVEAWKMGNMFPTSIKFGELDYSSSEIVEISLTLRYSDVTYTPSPCYQQVSRCGCAPCGAATGTTSLMSTT